MPLTMPAPVRAARQAPSVGRVRRVVYRLGAAALLLLATVGGWLVWQVRPKHAELLARRSPLASAVTQPEQVEVGGFVSQAVRLRAHSGLTVDLRVLRPDGRTGPLPLMVLLGGHRTGRDAVRLLGAPGRFVVAALDYPYDGPERPRGLWSSLATVPAARRTLLDTPAAVLLAIEWLAAQPWVDAGRMEIVGVSFGVPFAAVAAAAEPRLRRTWLIQGGAGNREWIEANLGDRVPPGWRRREASRLVWLLTHGPTLDAAHWTPQLSPRPVIIIGARQDRRVPPEIVNRLHALAGEPKELIWIEGDHIDRRAEAIGTLLAIVRARLGATDLAIAPAP